MSDKNVINVSPDTQVVFQKYEFSPKQNKKNVLINVLYGKVRSKVNQKYNGKTSKFQVKTPSAVAGVRGTDFLASYSQSSKTSQIVTFEGRVSFGLPGVNGSIKNPVSIGAGQVAKNISGNLPSTPRVVPPQQLAKMDNSSNADKAVKQEDRQPSNEGKKEKKEKKKKELKKEKAVKNNDKNTEEPKGEQAGNMDQEGEKAPEAGAEAPDEGSKDKQARKSPGDNGPKGNEGPDGGGPAMMNPDDTASGPGSENVAGDGPNGPPLGPNGEAVGPDGTAPPMGGNAANEGNFDPGAGPEGPAPPMGTMDPNGRDVASMPPSGDMVAAPPMDSPGGFMPMPGMGDMMMTDDLLPPPPSMGFLPDMGVPMMPNMGHVPNLEPIYNCDFCTETIGANNTHVIIQIQNGN